MSRRGRNTLICQARSLVDRVIEIHEIRHVSDVEFRLIGGNAAMSIASLVRPVIAMYAASA